MSAGESVPWRTNTEHIPLLDFEPGATVAMSFRVKRQSSGVTYVERDGREIAIPYGVWPCYFVDRGEVSG